MIDWRVKRAREKAAIRQVLKLDERLVITDALAAPWEITPMCWPDGTIGGWEIRWKGLRAEPFPSIYPTRDAALLALTGQALWEDEQRLREIRNRRE